MSLFFLFGLGVQVVFWLRLCLPLFRLRACSGVLGGWPLLVLLSASLGSSVCVGWLNGLPGHLPLLVLFLRFCCLVLGLLRGGLGCVAVYALCGFGPGGVAVSWVGLFLGFVIGCGGLLSL